MPLFVKFRKWTSSELERMSLSLKVARKIIVFQGSTDFELNVSPSHFALILSTIQQNLIALLPYNIHNVIPQVGFGKDSVYADLNPIISCHFLFVHSNVGPTNWLYR